jgi:hypothetical protein
MDSEAKLSLQSLFKNKVINRTTYYRKHRMLSKPNDCGNISTDSNTEQLHNSIQIESSFLNKSSELPSVNVEKYGDSKEYSAEKENITWEETDDTSYNILASVLTRDSGSDIEEEEEKKCFDSNLLYDIRKWSLKNNIAHTSLTALLKILHPFHETLPLDARTLLQLSYKVVKVVEIFPGKYWHYGLNNALRVILPKIIDCNLNVLHLDFNVDGLPISKSSVAQV